MENIEQKVRQKIEEILSQKCGGIKRKQVVTLLEELSIIPAIISLVSEIEKEKQDVIERLEKENKELKSKLNQVTFGNDPNRDKQILELHRLG